MNRLKILFWDNDRRFIWLLAIVYAILALRIVVDADIWTQLMVGRWVLDHGAVPHQEIFIYAGENNPQMFGGWGFGTVMELVVRGFGFKGLSYANGLLWGAVVFFFAHALRWRWQRALSEGQVAKEFAQEWKAGLCVALAVISMGWAQRANMRAEVTVYLGWAVALLAVEKARATGRPMIAWVSLPLVCWAVAWLHTGGFLLLLVWFLALGKFWKAKERGSLWGWALCLILAIGIPMANPNGVRQVYAQPISVVEALSNSYVGQQIKDRIGWKAEDTADNGASAGGARGIEKTKGVRLETLEYVSVFDHRGASFLGRWIVLLVVGVVAVWGAVFLVKNPVEMVCEIGVVVLGLVVSSAHVRAGGLAALFLFGPLAFICAVGLSRARLPYLAKGALVCGGLVLASVYMTEQGWGVQSAESESAPLIKTIKKLSPNGARLLILDFQNDIPYVLGPAYTIGHAGHALMPNDEMDAHYVTMLFGENDSLWSEIEKYKVDYVCVPYALRFVKGDPKFIWTSAMLASSSRWRLVANMPGCPLFKRERFGKELSPSDIELQTKAYLEIVKLNSTLWYKINGGLVDKALMDMADAKLKLMKEKELKSGG